MRGHIITRNWKNKIQYIFSQKICKYFFVPKVKIFTRNLFFKKIVYNNFLYLYIKNIAQNEQNKGASKNKGMKTKKLQRKIT